MIPTEQAARWLADCKRYAHNGTYGVMDEMKDGNWLHQDDALAAIARLFAPGGDLALIERLQERDKSKHGYCGYVLYNRDGPEAAARLSALTAEREELKAWKRHWQGEIDVILAGRADAEAEVSRLRARLARMEGALTDVSEDEDDKYLILKRGMYYRPNRKGYTSSPAEAGRYTLAQAVFITHPNGPDGPRDGMSFVPVAALTDGGSNG